MSRNLCCFVGWLRLAEWRAWIYVLGAAIAKKASIHAPPNVCEKSLLVIALAIELAIRSAAIAVDGPKSSVV